MTYLLVFKNGTFNELLFEHIQGDVMVHAQSFNDLETDLEKVNYLCNELTGVTNELRFDMGIENIEQMCKALKHGEFVLKAFDPETGEYTEIVYVPPINGISNVFPPTEAVEEKDSGLVELLEKRAALSEQMIAINQKIKEQMDEGLDIFASARVSLSDLHDEWSTVVSNLLDQTVGLESVDLESFGEYVSLVKQFSDKLHSFKP